jgi:DNA-binding MarR family transcriptional regulator
MAVADRKPTQADPSDTPAAPPSTRSTAASSGPARNGHAGLDLGVLDQHLGYLIRRFQVWVFQDFIRTLEAIDIRPAQYSVLVVIGANPGLSQSDLADTLGIERARLVRLLDRLDKRGLTRRLPSPRDRRSHALQLTAEGHKTLKKAKTLAAAHEARLIEKLGSEPRQAMLGFLRAFAR